MNNPLTLTDESRVRVYSYSLSFKYDQPDIFAVFTDMQARRFEQLDVIQQERWIQAK